MTTHGNACEISNVSSCKKSEEGFFTLDDVPVLPEVVPAALPDVVPAALPEVVTAALPESIVEDYKLYDKSE